MRRRSKSKSESESEPESDSNIKSNPRFKFKSKSKNKSNSKIKSDSKNRVIRSISSSASTLISSSNSASPSPSSSSSLPSSASSSMPSLVLSPTAKATRRFSLGRLFRRKSSLAAIDEVDESTPLRRRNTVADRVGKLLRRVSQRGDEGQLFMEKGIERARHVSSFYQSPTGSLAELQTESMDELGDSKMAITPPVTPLPKSAVCTKWSPDIVPLKVLTSTRCALQHNGRLIQGHLTVTTRKVRFQATANQGRLHFEIPYTDIVAIIPNQYYGTGAVHLATQSRLVRIVNLPERTTILRVLVDEWNMHCRCMLLGAAHAPVPKLTMSQTDWLVDVVDDATISATDLSLDRLSAKYPCGCDSHFQEKVIEATLPGAPLTLVDTLFGGLNNPQGVAMNSVFWVYEDAIIDEGPWEDVPRHRIVNISVPNPSQPTQRLQYCNEQTVLRETADIIVISSNVTEVNHKSTGLEEAKFRWCITRTGIDEKSHVLITGETESSILNLSLKTDEMLVFRVIVGRFKDIFADIRLKNTVAPDPPPVLGWIARTRDRIRQMFIFVIGPVIMESFPHVIRSPGRLLVAFSFLCLFGWLLLRWTCPTPVLPVDHLFVEQYLENVIRENRKIMHNVSQRLDHIRDQIEL